MVDAFAETRGIAVVSQHTGGLPWTVSRPFHGGNRGSIPLGRTNFKFLAIRSCSRDRRACDHVGKAAADRLVEELPL